MGCYSDAQSMQCIFIHIAEGRLFFLLDIWTLNMSIDPAKQTEMWALARPNRLKMWLTARPNRLDVDIGQTKQAKMCVLARPNRPKSNKINVLLKNFPLHLLIQNLSDNSNTFQCYVCIYLKSVSDKKGLTVRSEHCFEIDPVSFIGETMCTTVFCSANFGRSMY